MKKKIVAMMLSMALVFGMTTSAQAGENSVGVLAYYVGVAEFEGYINGLTAEYAGFLKDATVGGDWYDEDNYNVATTLIGWDGTVYIIDQVCANGVKNINYFINGVNLTCETFNQYLENSSTVYYSVVK